MKKVNPYTLYLSGVLSENQYLSEVEAPEVAGVNKNLLQSFDAAREPKNGDKAYSIYSGKMFVGVLHFEGVHGEKESVSDRHIGSWYPDHLKQAQGYRVPRAYLMFPPFSWVKNPMKVHEHGGLEVGYEGPIVWDQKEGMFYAPANSD
jgi:hypothetical protein